MAQLLLRNFDQTDCIQTARSKIQISPAKQKSYLHHFDDVRDSHTVPRDVAYIPDARQNAISNIKLSC